MDAGKKGVSMGFNALKYDIDEGSRSKQIRLRYNWTASPGELIRMEEQIAAAREANQGP